MPPITATTVVNRPAPAVFAYAIDPTHFSEWQQGVVEGRMETDGAPTVGTRCVTTRRIGFAKRPATAEVTRFDPPVAWSVRGIDGPIRAAVDLTVEAVDESRARLIISIDFEGRGIGRLLVPLVVNREARKEMPSNLANLKACLESN